MLERSQSLEQRVSGRLSLVLLPSGKQNIERVSQTSTEVRSEHFHLWNTSVIDSLDLILRHLCVFSNQITADGLGISHSVTHRCAFNGACAQDQESEKEKNDADGGMGQGAGS